MIIRMVLFTDDPMIILMVLSTDDPMIKFRFFCRILQAIRWSYFSFFAKNYRWSDDHISVFLPKITDDPMITFRFFSHFLLRIASLLFFNQLRWFLLFLVQRNYFLCNISHTTRWLWWWSWHIISHVQLGVSHHSFLITFLLSPSPPLTPPNAPVNFIILPPPHLIFHYAPPHLIFHYSHPQPVFVPPNKVKSWALNAN